MVVGFRQRSLYSLAKRLRLRLFETFGNRLPRTQRLYLVTINGQRFKRLVLPDAHQAWMIATNLREFGAAGIYPSLLIERENELWVEYVEGRRIEQADTDIVAKLARLFAVLYRRRPRLVCSEDTPFNHSLHVDLHFLNQVGVLGDGIYRQLDKLADVLTPSKVWVGYDCTDAILKNFVICEDGRIRGVDVESLGGDQPTGIGVAKARLRWLGGYTDRFLAELRASDALCFDAYLPFLDLCFLAFWTKSSFLERKQRFVNPERFERFVQEWDRGA